MWKSLIEKFKSKNGRKGYTLTELLVVIGVIALVCAIAIPSVIMISRSLKFKQRNDYAKSIFMAAQQNLTEMRSDGGLKALRETEGAGLIADAGFPDEFRDEYVYTYNGTAAFELVLPVGSIDSAVRDEQIIVEYNPLTGNVYAVFYSEENESILSDYIGSGLPRDDEKARKKQLLGYYDGSGLASSELELERTQASVLFTNDEEGVVTVLVPMPDSFTGTYMEFATALEVELTITGEYSMMSAVAGVADDEETGSGTGSETAADKSFKVQIKQSGNLNNCSMDNIDGRNVRVTFPIDSLRDKMSFANYASNTQVGAKDASNNSTEAALTERMDESEFLILPGENVTIQADVSFRGNDEIVVQVDPGILSGVNPMFEYLQPSGSGGYVLAVSNGRNLQNLNALAPAIAELVDTVVFTDDIYWNNTVEYYNKEYGTVTAATYSNSAAENPARALPYFVPIHNEGLFGTARFIFPGEGDGGLGSILEDLLNALVDFIFGGYSNKKVPTLTDEMDAANNVVHATIEGNGHKVYNLNIDSTKYTVPNVGKTENVPNTEGNGTIEVSLEGKFYATGSNQIVDYCFTGLFGYANTTINDLHVVNPIVKGHEFEQTYKTVTKYLFGFIPIGTERVYQYNNPATGALLGVGGYNTLVTNCSTYIDKEALGFDSSRMTHGVYNSTGVQDWYGVSGEGAVGGLVGYAKSHRTVSGELTDDEKHLAFSRSFAAVNVSGNMRGTNSKDFGYSNGVGGFIGNSQLTNFYNCYASGDVKVTGCYVKTISSWSSLSELIIDIFGMEPKMLYDGRTGQGGGGFVGTSHGTRYTNCFATGDVIASSTNSSASDAGGGGFVGFMSIDETFSYGNDSNSSSEVAQRTVFTNCYSVGKAVTDGETVENFSGANGRIVYSPGQSNAYVTGDYFRLYAPHYVREGTPPSYEDVYIYRDTYFLANYHVTSADAQDSSSNCANPEPYESFVDMVGKHSVDGNGNPTEWIEAQIDSIKNISLGTKRVTVKEPVYDRHGNLLYYKNVTKEVEITYETEYFQPKAPALENIYVSLYDTGYSSENWEAATVNTTHAYDLSSPTARYPFSKIKGLDYYGDWPSQTSSLGMAYYESYESDSTDSNLYYYFDRESTSTLLNLEGTVVDQDGYAILSAKSDGVTVTINNVTETLQPQTSRFQAGGNNEYYIFLLTDDLMNAAASACTGTNFYAEVSVTQGSDSYTMYFNPSVAMSHLNPGYKQNHVSEPTADDVPRTMYIRSARQFKALSSMDNYWSADYTYIQQLNIDASGYDWDDEINNPTYVDSIGSAENPFNATYTITSTMEQTAISGLTPTEAGFFGVIGEKGTVENLTLTMPSATVNGSGTPDAAVLAGANKGAITNVDLTVNGAVDVTADTNAGILVGYSSGTVTDCEVAVAGAVTVNAPNAGGFAGNVAGTETTKATMTNGTVEVGGVLTVTASDGISAGGFFGSITNAEASNLTVALEGIAASANNAGGLAGYAENTTLTTAEITLAGSNANSKAAGVMAGVIGSARATELSAINIAMATGGTLSGDTAAGFIGTAVDTNAEDSGITIGGSISGVTKAAGVVASMDVDSDFSRVPAVLTGAAISASNGDAAGYAIEIKGDVLNSNVILGDVAQNTNTTISGTAKAAGYACTIGGFVDNSKVTGAGAISGARAAGYAVDVSANGQVALAGVTPALTAEAYRGNSNANLTVTGSKEAAGFALNVGSSATITNSYVLCAVGGGGNAAYGFAGTNAGSISGSTANVDIGKGYAFVGKNEGAVYRCYGWYGDKDAAKTETVATVDGSCYSSYFVDLDPNIAGVEAIEELTTVTLYTAAGGQPESITPDFLQVKGMDLLTSDTTDYKWYTTGYASYPYAQLGTYNYPMLRDHYGNWTIPPQYAYGIAYFETYQDGSTKLDIVDLSDHTLTVDRKSLSGMITIRGGAVVTDAVTAFDNSGTINDHGYAVFCKPGLNPLTDLTVSETAIEGLTYGRYSFYRITDTNAFTVTSKAAGNAVTTVNPKFADAFNDSEVYEVRTAEQLANIGTVTANFTQTHDITVADNSGVAAAVLGAGHSYDGSNLNLTFQAPASSWMSSVAGTVQNLNIAVTGGLNSSIFETVSGTVNIGTVSVTGGVNGSIVGAVAGGSVTTGNISTDAVSGMIFGDVSGNVTTGEIAVSGSVNQVFGAVNGGVVTVSKINTGDVAGKIFGDVSGNVTLGDITVSNDESVGTLFGAINGGTVTGSAEATAINLGSAAISGNLFASVSNNATVQNFKVTASGTSASLVGGSLAGTLKNLEIECASANVGTASGVLVGNMASGLIDGCTVDVDAIQSSAATFGGITGVVEAGEVRNSAIEGSITVNAENLSNGNAVFGGLVAEIKANAGLSDNTVNATMAVSGKDDKLTIVGGLAGINAGTITGGSAEAVINYTQSTSDMATIGGLVGSNSGMVTGKAVKTEGAKDQIVNLEVGGAINLAGTGAGKAYVVGGVIGKDEGAVYQHIASTADVSAAWKGGKLVATGAVYGENDALMNPSGLGPVGKFVGYVSSGTFTNCSGLDMNTASGYQFLGEIVAGNVTGAYMNNVKHENGISAVQDAMNTEDTAYYPSDSAANGKFVAVDPAQSFTAYYAALTDCYYSGKLADGEPFAKIRQDIGAQWYFYNKTDKSTFKGYATKRITQVSDVVAGKMYMILNGYRALEDSNHNYNQFDYVDIDENQLAAFADGAKNSQGQPIMTAIWCVGDGGLWKNLETERYLSMFKYSWWLGTQYTGSFVDATDGEHTSISVAGPDSNGKFTVNSASGVHLNFGSNFSAAGSGMGFDIYEVSEKNENTADFSLVAAPNHSSFMTYEAVSTLALNELKVTDESENAAVTEPTETTLPTDETVGGETQETTNE